MSGYRLPSPQGAWIDRTRKLNFQFNGREVPGFAGDTVASALLAHGVMHVGRSFKLHRPRGIFSCGVEEPTGLVDVGSGGARTPNTRATDIAAVAGLQAATGNAWPSLGFDLAAVSSRFASLMPAGFYYKTFMWPHWHRFEPMIRRMAGLGVAADAPDLDRYDQVSRQVQVLVVGAGAAGVQAALAAAQTGQQVLLLEGAPQLDPASAARLPELARAGVEVITACTVFGLYDHRLAAAVQTVAGAVRERLWKIRAGRIILATGAFERPLLFPDNDRPGVMLANAVLRYATHYGVACGRHVVVTTACDSGYLAARGLMSAGVHVAAIVDHRSTAAIEAPAGVPVLRSSAIVAVQGRRAVKGIEVAAHGGGALQHLEADCIASAGGWAPAVHLHSMAGGTLRWVDQCAMFVPDRAAPGIDSVGACAGVFDPARALEHATAVGRGHAEPAPVGGLGTVAANSSPSDAALAALMAAGRRPGKVFVDLQNDVAADDVALAARENYRSVEHLKRYTTLGMATDQGKTSNVNALVLMGQHTGRSPGQVGTTRFRPPFKPVTLATLAAGRVGARSKPLKHMPGHAWHEAHSPAWEEFGGWQRPAAYARDGESLNAAAEREALHVRTHVGLFEASPLGKIELYGPDAAAFLDLMYVGTMSTLAVGQARYGLLLREDGILFDDGIVARLGDQHYWVNTTSGGAERVALAFEEWLQCEYVHHQVLVTPVTSAWGNVTVAGPQAWALLQAAGFDAALAPGVMRHMTCREVTHTGVVMRVLRASFSGELGYEINVPAQHTQALLEHLWQAGQPFGVAPYGVEALMILRTEKGYLHVGADTDGTTFPGDVGLDRGIAKKGANFVGRRSLMRPVATDADRMQLVGLLPQDRRSRLPVGAHITPHAPPAPIEGYVTSSVFSPVLGHPVALAMLERGGQRVGEQVTAYHLGRPFVAEVVKTPFLDAAGERLNA
ncbi:MAG: 2Fe-2S iron-sulfur cluster-binding protein [Rubrivivax sp.]|jgi:sarcosine oxidase subunit alpha|nr:2Fe-2S iron-sulfur cluster-binding protein [Rubrivivax sp.]